MGFDLDKIDMGLPQNGGPGKGFDSSKIAQGTPDAFLGGPSQATDFSDFRFQPKTNADNFKLRAQDQGFWESTGKRIGNLIPNIAGGIVETVGYMGSLVTEWGDDRDYNNSLTQLGHAMKNPLGQVYRENPEKVWDLSDPAWWGDAFFGLAESAVSFAISGAGMAKIFGGLTTLAKASGLGRTGVKIAQGAAQLSTAASLAYSEGAMSGAMVFDKTLSAQYQKLIEAGMDPDEANSIAAKRASEAAAATVQLNTMINTALNLTALTPLFKSNDEILDWWTTKGRRAQGESFDDWATRIKATTSESSDIAKMLNPRGGAWGLGFESLQEGTEEMVNVFAEKRGMERGEKGQHNKGLGDLLGDLSHFADDTMNEEGALNFMLGAFGGVAQTVFLDHMPFHKSYVTDEGDLTDHAFEAAKDEKGRYKTKLVSSSQRGPLGERKYFEGVKEKVVHDIDRIQKLNADLATAIANNQPLEAERIKAKMFDTGALNAVGLGLASNFRAQYEDIAKLDNSKSLHEDLVPNLATIGEAIAQETDTLKKQELQQQYDATVQQIQKLTNVTEAMQKGYAKDMNDNEYKRKAEEAAKLVDEYDALWKDISAQHRSGDEWDGRYADYLFNKEVQIKSRERIIKEEERKLQASKERRAQSLHPEEDAVTMDSIKKIHADSTAADNLKLEEGKIRRALSLVASGNEAEVAQGKKMLEDIATKYELHGDSENDIIPAAHRVLNHFKEKQEQLLDTRSRAIEEIQGTTQYEKWKEKNPSKTVVDYVNAQLNKTGVDNAIAQHEQKINNFKDETDIARKELAYTRSMKGKRDYIAQAKATKNAQVKKMNERIAKQNAAFIDTVYDGKNVTELSKLQRSEYMKMLEKKQVEVEDEIKALTAKGQELANELHATILMGFMKRLSPAYRKMQRDMQATKDKIYSLETSLATIKNRIDEVQNSAIPAEEVLPQRTANPLPASSSDDDIRAWIGDDNVYSDVLDGIWSLRQTGDAAVNAAFELLMDQLEAITHPWLRESQANQSSSSATIVTFLSRHLQSAGKISAAPVAPAASTVTPQATTNPLGKMVENGYKADAYHYKSPAAEINVGKPLGSTEYQVTISLAANTTSGYALKNSLTQSFERLEDALEYANKAVEKAEEQYAKKQATPQTTTPTGPTSFKKGDVIEYILKAYDKREEPFRSTNIKQAKVTHYSASKGVYKVEGDDTWHKISPDKNIYKILRVNPSAETTTPAAPTVPATPTPAVDAQLEAELKQIEEWRQMSLRAEVSKKHQGMGRGPILIDRMGVLQGTFFHYTDSAGFFSKLYKEMSMVTSDLWLTHPRKGKPGYEEALQEAVEDIRQKLNRMYDGSIKAAHERAAKRQASAVPTTPTPDSDLIQVVNKHTASQEQAAEILSYLSGYEQDVRAAKEVYNTDTLIYMLQMGYSLDKAAATIVEQAFAKAHNFGTAQAVAIAPEVKAAPVTPAPAPQAAKPTSVEDIERRRQEELNAGTSYYFDEADFEQVRTTVDNDKRLKAKINLPNEAIRRVNDAYSGADIAKILEEYNPGRDLSSSSYGIHTLVGIIEDAIYAVNKPFPTDEEINARYDAELAALGQAPAASTASSVVTVYQGYDGAVDHRSYNYWAASEAEAKNYGSNVRSKDIDTTGFLKKRNPDGTWTAEYDALVKEFTATGEGMPDILDNSPKGLKRLDRWFKFLEDKGYTGYQEGTQGSSENAYYVTFDKPASSGPAVVMPAQNTTPVVTVVVNNYNQEQLKNMVYSGLATKLDKKQLTLEKGKTYVRVRTDNTNNPVEVEKITGTGETFEYTYMSGYTGAGNTQSSKRDFPTYIDSEGKEKKYYTPDNVDFYEVPSIDLDNKEVVLQELRNNAQKIAKANRFAPIGITETAPYNGTVRYYDEDFNIRKADINWFGSSKEEQIQKLYDKMLEDLHNKVTVNQIPGPGPVVSNIGQPLNFNPSITYEHDHNSGYHAGKKVIDVISGAVLTHEYFDEMTLEQEQETEGGVTLTGAGRRVYKKRDKYSLNPRVHRNWLLPGAITPGTPLTLAVDEQWDGTINDDHNYQYGGPRQREDRITDYIGADGTISLEDEAIYGNVPIKIMIAEGPQAGQTVAYIRRMDWVTAKYPDTDDYRNVVNEIYDEEGNLVEDNNVEVQRQRLLELRRKIIEGYNNNRKVLPSAVVSRSAGIPLRDAPGKASDMLPDPGLKLGISAIGQGLVTVGAYEEAVANVIFPSYMTEGSFGNVPGALIPDASGRLHFEPLWTNRLSKPEIDTTIRAIEIYLTIGSDVTPEAQARAEADAEYIQRHTNFDVTTPRGLENFINQYYYYSRTFDDQLTAVNTGVLGQPTRRRPEFMLSIAREAAAGRDKVEIKAGVSYLSRTQRAQVDENGRIRPEFARLLHDPSSGMASRFRNIVLARPERGLRGLNSKGEIREVIYRPESREFSYVQHNSYNDLVKEHSMTTLYGKLQLPGGPSSPYVYFAHPVTQLDPEVTMAAPTGRRVEPTEITEIIEQAEAQQAEATTRSGRRRRTGITGTPGSSFNASYIEEADNLGNVPGEEVSLENLQKLLTFTPIGNRNGKTPAEVLVEMKRLGIATLTKGHNPFFQC